MDNWCSPAMGCTAHNLFSAYQTVDFESLFGFQNFKQLTRTLCKIFSLLSKTIQTLYYPHTYVHFYLHIIPNRYSATVLQVQFEHRLICEYHVPIYTRVKLVDIFPNPTLKKPISRLKNNFWSSFVTRNLGISATKFSICEKP